MNQRLTQSSECTKIILKIYQFWHFNMSFEKTFNLWNIILLHRTFSSHGEDRDRVPDNKALPVWHPSKVLWVFMQGRPDCHVWPHLTGHHRNIRNGNSVVILLSKHQTVIWRENKQVQTLPCQAQRPLVTTGGDTEHLIWYGVSDFLWESDLWLDNNSRAGNEFSFYRFIISGAALSGWWCQTKVVISSQMSYLGFLQGKASFCLNNHSVAPSGISRWGAHYE